MVRVKLKFDSTPVSYAQKCWFVFDSEKCRLVKDVAHLITSHFSLRSALGIQLYMDDYLVPTNETVQVIRDGDLIQVRTVSHSDSSSSDSEDSHLPVSKRIKANATVQSPPSSPPPVKELVAVTKKSACGGLHTKFRSDSSSSASSSSSSEDTSDSSPKPKTKSATISLPTTQWDVKKKSVSQSKIQSMLGKKNLSSSSITKRIAANINRRGRGLNRRNVITGMVVGGPKDVLSTRSRVYTGRSVVHGKIDTVGATAEKKSKKVDQDRDKEEEEKGEIESNESSSDNSEVESTQAPVEVKDYTSYPDLQGPPRVGDKLAFKVLELSSSYTPEVSLFREGTVVDFDHSTNTVRLKYSEDTVSQMLQEASHGNAGKFSLDASTSEESPKSEAGTSEVKEEVDLVVSEMLQPKLIQDKPDSPNN